MMASSTTRPIASTRPKRVASGRRGRAGRACAVGFEARSSSNGLFICYAPADDPQVAIAQIVEKGAWGSNTIGIARDLLTAYFGLDEAQAAPETPLRPGLTDALPTP